MMQLVTRWMKLAGETAAMVSHSGFVAGMLTQ